MCFGASHLTSYEAQKQRLAPCRALGCRLPSCLPAPLHLLRDACKPCLLWLQSPSLTARLPACLPACLPEQAPTGLTPPSASASAWPAMRRMSSTAWPCRSGSTGPATRAPSCPRCPRCRQAWGRGAGGMGEGGVERFGVLWCAVVRCVGVQRTAGRCQQQRIGAC